MKKRILAAVLAVLMVLPMAVSVFADARASKVDYVTAEWGGKEGRVEAMGEPVAQSPDGNMLLYVDKASGEMAIKNQKTGDIVLSNPCNIASSGLLKREKPYALSQLDLNFTYVNTGDTKTFHSYGDCFAVGQAVVEVVANGIKVSYTLGAQEVKLLVPDKISVDELEELFAKFTAGTTGSDEVTIENVKRRIRGAFNLYCSYEAIGPMLEKYPYLKEQVEWLKNPSPTMAQAGVKEYPIAGTTPIYVIKGADSEGNKWIEGYLKQYLRDYVEQLVDTTEGDVEAGTEESATDLDERITNYLKTFIETTYAKVEEPGIDDFSDAERPKFYVEATYKVTNTGLEATVDAGSLEYDTSKYTVNTIALLPYFNAANASHQVKVGDDYITTCDKGYTFIPDGSGALVRFEDLFADNNKQVKFENDMYGNDYAYYQVKTRNSENMAMPVFGLTNNTSKTGFFAIIEDGDALGVITSNHSTAFHSIYTAFKITPSDTYDLADSFSSGTSSSKKIGIKANNVYLGECKVSYNLLVDDEVAAEAGLESYYSNSYLGMANFYRDYLQAKGAISKLTDNQINPEFTKLFLETFGSIKVEEKIATFPVTVNKALTTFSDIKTMYDELKAEGVDNTTFILKGFANGGLLSTYPTSVKWQKVLGGESGFNDLLDYAEKNDFEVAPDVEFSYSYGSATFSGFTNKKYGVRTLDNRYTTKRTYYAATQTFERTGGVAVSSASFEYLYSKFYKSVSKYDIEFLSVRSLGSDLNSDFDEDDYYDREASKDKVVAMLKLLSGESGNKAYKLVLDAGHSYAIPYADAILSASLDSSRRSEMSESVPFFGIVFHGSVEFAGNAYNMEGDTDYAFLKAIENGASLYFTVAKQNVELLKFDPEYNKYYSVSYDNLKSTIVSVYKEYNAVMKDLQNKYIVNHGFVDATRVEDGGAVDNSQVVMVEYEGGVGFILNYSAYEINVTAPNGENVTIQPFEYHRYTK